MLLNAFEVRLRTGTPKGLFAQNLGFEGLGTLRKRLADDRRGSGLVDGGQGLDELLEDDGVVLGVEGRLDGSGGGDCDGCEGAGRGLSLAEGVHDGGHV